MKPFVNLAEQRNAYRQEFEEIEKDILDSGCYIGGPQVKNLEKELSCYIGKGKNNGKSYETITCGSGTDALTIALMALAPEKGFRHQDEIIVPDFTFIAPAESISALGAMPKFADINPKTLQIAPESVAKLVNSNTRGIIAVNLFGQCAPYGELREIADKFGLWIIEDSAQAFGAYQSGKPACTFGDIAITSFYPTKPLGCYGDGGALFTQDRALAEKIRMIANHGSRGHYEHEIIGMNSRLDALQAGILRVKLRHLDEELAARRQNAVKYNSFFISVWNQMLCPGNRVTPQSTAEENLSTYAQYTVLAENRGNFIKRLQQAEIPYCIHYPTPLHSQPCFKAQNLDPQMNAIADEICHKVVSLPVCAFTDVDEIIGRLTKAMG